MKKNYGKILVLMGGWSNEREISLISGQYVFDSLISLGLDAVKLDLRKDNVGSIKEINPDRVFIVLHGKGGEDGEIQFFLETLGIPYTGSGSKSSEICMNKRNTKNILIEEKILTPAYQKIDENTTVEYIEKHFQYPFVVKPSTEGSSIGVYIVEDRQSYLKAINENLKISNDIIIEQYIDGNEYTVALVGNIALPVIKLVPPGKFYDYEAKYNSNDTKYICPSELSDNVEEELKKISLKVFQSIKLQRLGKS